jgi:hypothetical protein
MTLNPLWVPMKWPCGPLEKARLEKSSSLSSDLKDVADAAAQPDALEVLRGTPISCLVVDWALGTDQDSRQQQVLQPLIAAGRQLGMSFVGKITSKDVATAAEAGRTAGLDSVILTEPAIQPLALPVISQFPRDKVDWKAAAPIFVAADSPWPGLALDGLNGDVAVGGPTGVPWVNSNGWFSLLAREMAPGKNLWLDCDPPDSASVSHSGSYALAVADSCAYGVRWIISLDPLLRAAILKRTSNATGIWREITQTGALFEQHRKWATFESQGTLQVVSSFSGDDAYLSGEILNLLSRRQVQYRISERTDWRATPSAGTQSILWADKGKPSSEQLANLLAFVRQGGLVIAPEYWGPAGAKAHRKDPSLRYSVYNIGPGQIAVADKGFEDPFQVAMDTHLLTSRRNDLVRLYSPDSVNCYLCADPRQNQTRLVHILNYSGDPAQFVTVWVRGHASAAHIFRPEAPDPLGIRSATANRGTDLHVPKVTVCCAVEFTGEI